MRIIDVAKKPPVTVAPGMSLQQAAKVMDEAGAGALLVLDGQRLAGIVTDRDIVLRGLAEGMGPDARIDAVMTTDPVTVDANADASEASEAFAERKFRRLPVMQAGAVVGLLSADDLLLLLITQLSDAVWPIVGEVLDPRHEGRLPVSA